MTRKFRPTTPGQRSLILTSNSQLTREGKTGRQTVKPHKPLLQKKMKTNGRNHHGHITCRHRGGGHKRFYRVVDFKRDKEGIGAKVASVEYDPNRTAFIALLNYADGEKRYILAPEGLKAGDVVMTSDQPPYNPGCCMRLKAMPLGSTIHNLELVPGRGGKLVRSAGLSAQLMARSGGYATIKMPSGEVRLINENCRATLGVVSNGERSLRVEGKAGRMRWKGIRPTVRGTAMNPVDHPHGGGEGKHNGYLPQTPWAQYTKGYRTRSKRKSNKMIVKRRKK
ncbi:MAG: 50S ribosomal protein L2 [Chlamydiae bacterium]|nr:50S ribosomal protein L2 [Chlamydiota bacterium]